MSTVVRASLLPLALLLAIVAACDPVLPPDGDDAGTSGHDAGDGLDAGDGADAGDLPDAGESPDAGDAPDAGETPDGGGGEPVTAVPEVMGEWDDNFGGSALVTGTHWDAMALVQVDNTANRVVVRNPDDAAFDPGKFNLLEWTEPEADGAFHLCWLDFGLDTAEEAAATINVADDTSPSTGGCGGFPWSRYVAKPLEVRGDFDDDFGGRLLVDHRWGGDTVRAMSNTDNWVVTQSPADAEFNPSKFNRITWTEKTADGSFYACWTDFGLDTAQLALESATAVDDSDPASGGCGGFPWSLYRPHVDQTTLDITGSWVDDYGDRHVITNTTYEVVGFGVETVVSFDNRTRSLILQAGQDPVFPSPGTFARLHWLPDDGGLWVCTPVSGKADAATARSTPATLDTTNPATGGCDGPNEPWTRLEPAIAP